jgi:hypothetical protein
MMHTRRNDVVYAHRYEAQEMAEMVTRLEEFLSPWIKPPNSHP